MRRLLSFAAVALAHLALTYAALGATLGTAASMFFEGRPASLTEGTVEAAAVALSTPVIVAAYAGGVNLLAPWRFEVAAVLNSLVWAAALTLGWNALSRRRRARRAPLPA